MGVMERATGPSRLNYTIEKSTLNDSDCCPHGRSSKTWESPRNEKHEGTKIIEVCKDDGMKVLGRSGLLRICTIKSLNGEKNR